MTKLRATVKPYTFRDRYVSLELVTDHVLTREEQIEAQTSAGFIPEGYGLYALDAKRLENGQILNYWQCMACCD